MYAVRTTIDIDRPPARVWEVLTDFSRYREWNHLIVAIRANLEPGAPVDFKFSLGRGRPVPIQARMLRVEPERDFRWRGPRSELLGRVISGEHYFSLEDLGEGRTRFVHGEQFHGPLMALLWPRLSGRLEVAYRGMNEAVKRRAESAAPSGAATP